MPRMLDAAAKSYGVSQAASSTQQAGSVCQGLESSGCGLGAALIPCGVVSVGEGTAATEPGCAQ